MSQAISNTTAVTLEEAKNLIALCGADVTIMLQGGMGIGKSSLLWALAEQFNGTHDAVYMDMTTKDIADLSGVPYVEERAEAAQQKAGDSHAGRVRQGHASGSEHCPAPHAGAQDG